jgi:AcrR family transcriptional regulator
MGLRERKKQKTREAIQRAALRLFSKQGYEETTVEEIAAAAEISPSTFFNYFPTKEDVVLYDMYDPMTIEMILKRPKDEPLNTVARHVLEGMSELMERDKEMMLERAKLVMEVPELRGRMWDELERTQTVFAQALAERTRRSVDDFELRVTTRIFVAAMYEAALEWMRDNGRESLAILADRALAVMERGATLSTIAKTPIARGGAKRRAKPRAVRRTA